MSKAERGWQVFTKCDEYGIANSGLAAVINDRDTSLIVPWHVPTDLTTDPIEIEWDIEDEEGHTWFIKVPVTLSNNFDGTATAYYEKGTYTVE